MKKFVLSFLIIIILSFSGNNFIQAGKPACKDKCTSYLIHEEHNPVPDEFFPYYRFINI